MASGFFALLDDIATILDDVTAMTKVAAQKTSAVLGDDLALNAKQIAGVSASREFPVVLAVAKGSALNKLILIPLAIIISVVAPWAVTPLLMVGGLYLCFEGCEKIFHALFHSRREFEVQKQKHLSHLEKTPDELLILEREKIRDAIRTDFILSAEIIVISLGIVSDAVLLKKIAVLSLIGVLMTVGVYGLVAIIIKIDDLGLWMMNHRRSGRGFSALGRALVLMMPPLMKILSVVGTIAMFLVGGGILNHGIPSLHHFLESVSVGLPLPKLFSLLLDAGLGVAAGTMIVLVVEGAKKIRKSN
jgi:predicted DNA repair protein MutK